MQQTTLASRAIAGGAGRLNTAWGPYLSSHEEHVWAAVTTTAVILLLLSGGYRRLEKITTVLVAAQDIHRRATLAPTDLTTVQMPASAVPPGALTRVKDAVGQVAQRPAAPRPQRG